MLQRNLPKESKAERIAKVIARAGLCSRREAERWITEGRVRLNGKPLNTPAVTVIETDIVLVNGQPLPSRERTRLWRYHKPVGLVTSHRDEQGRSTVFEKMPNDIPRVVSVGRLDLNSQGLLLLTNDGELARTLEMPKTGWARRYRARVHGRVNLQMLNELAKGLMVNGVKFGPIKATLDNGGNLDKTGSNAWLTISLAEGKNREVRKVMAHLGLKVNRLIRTAYGPFQLGKLTRGRVEEIKGKVLREQLGRLHRNL